MLSSPNRCSLQKQVFTVCFRLVQRFNIVSRPALLSGIGLGPPMMGSSR